MTHHHLSRRRLLQNGAYAGAGAIILSGCTDSGGGKQGAAGGANGALPPIEGAQVVLDPAQYPKKFAEWPEFAKQVSAGQLPPVAERIGQDPLVLKPVREAGRYGGQIRRGFIGTTDWLNGANFCGGPDTLLYWDYQGEKVNPNLARSYALSDGDRVLTLQLRRGMKWSDGKPFTADDIVFWREDINLHPDLGRSGTAALRAGGKNVEVKKVDDYTVQFISSVPNSILVELLASNDDLGGLSAAGRLLGGGYAPKHYLSQFHPKYRSESEVNKAAKDAGFDDWTAYFKDRMSWESNTKLPALTPWIVSRPISSPPWEFTANPYSIWVDDKGNQLPYIPKVTLSNTESPEVFNLRAVAGQYDFQDRNLTVANLPVLLRNQERSKYTIHRAPNEAMEFGVRINLAYNKDKTLGDLLRNVDFRRALSLGIDRNQLNNTYSLGTSKPSATTAGDTNRYSPGPEWHSKWATFDPAQANTLLDKVGLTKRDGSGFRVRPDGKGRIVLDYQSVRGLADFVGMGEMIKRQWQKIGIDLNVQQIAPPLAVQRAVANQLMLSGHFVGTDDPFLRPDIFLPTNINNYPGMIGIPYARWFATGGRTGTEPPQSLDLLKKAMDLYQQGLRSPEAERVTIGKQLYQMHADQVWSIGVFGFGLLIFGIYEASNRLGNVPGRIRNTLVQRTPNNLFAMTFYYK
ncbi:MAG TPA: ABC transporter substrate-binding protein [Streptosporangiaceae bacterium]|nr:ABC transporter substrate-binding protein [Streptosporangiaceae bacterium]